MGLWAAVAQRDYLLGSTGSGEHAMLDVVREVAYPVAILTELGISIAAFAQAMQCIIISPRLLQVLILNQSVVAGSLEFASQLLPLLNQGKFDA